jgi:hypothetical protein
LPLITRDIKGYQGRRRAVGDNRAGLRGPMGRGGGGCRNVACGNRLRRFYPLSQPLRRLAASSRQRLRTRRGFARRRSSGPTAFRSRRGPRRAASPPPCAPEGPTRSAGPPRPSPVPAPPTLTAGTHGRLHGRQQRQRAAAAGSGSGSGPAICAGCLPPLVPLVGAHCALRCWRTGVPHFVAGAHFQPQQ